MTTNATIMFTSREIPPKGNVKCIQALLEYTADTLFQLSVIS